MEEHASRNRIFGLAYHDVVAGADFDASGFPGKLPAHYKLEQEHFRQHLEAMRRVLGERRMATTDQPAPGTTQIFLTFDDGGVSAYDPIAGLLESHGWQGHFFVTTDGINRPGFLTPAQIRKLRQRGHVIGSHSCHHPVQMARCSWEKLIEEWGQSAAILADILGEPVTVAAVPGGLYSREVARAAAAVGIHTLFNSQPTERPHVVDGCTVIGRYAILRTTPPAVAGGLVSDGKRYRYQQQLSWTTKKIVKKIGGRLYLTIRGALLGSAGESEVTELSRLLPGPTQDPRHH